VEHHRIASGCFSSIRVVVDPGRGASGLFLHLVVFILSMAALSIAALSILSM
jgi:hypothetical protein